MKPPAALRFDDDQERRVKEAEDVAAQRAVAMGKLGDSDPASIETILGGSFHLVSG